MNAPHITTVITLADRFVGWVAERLGRAIGMPALALMGRDRQLRATVMLHCARVKVDAGKSMRSWKLRDTRLLNVGAASGTR